jgi:hypothetical protein
MHKITMAAVLAAAATVATAAAAIAATTMASMSMTSTSASVVCRPVSATDHPNAQMGSRGLLCKDLTPTMVGGKMPVPDTGSSSDAAWRTWLLHVIDVTNGAQQGG